MWLAENGALCSVCLLQAMDICITAVEKYQNDMEKCTQVRPAKTQSMLCIKHMQVASVQAAFKTRLLYTFHFEELTALNEC